MDRNRSTSMLIYILLKERNSKEKAVTVGWIRDELLKRWPDRMAERENGPIAPDAKTVRKHIEELMELADGEMLECVIETFEHKGTRHYYSRPRFEESEIKMLCDAVAFSRFIDRKYSEDLIRKLSGTIGVDWSGRYHPVLQTKDQGRLSYNSEFFLNIESLSEAIENKRKVKLVYTRYDIRKKLVPAYPEHDGVITVHPYSLIWTLNHYYLFCEIEESGERRFLRVDKIKDVRLQEDAVKPLPRTLNLTKYMTNQAFMFGGEPVQITLRCHKKMIGQVIDHFGEDADIRPLDDDHFEFHVVSSIESMKYWVLQYITAIDDIRPKELRKIVVDFLEDALKRNKT